MDTEMRKLLDHLKYGFSVGSRVLVETGQARFLGTVIEIDRASGVVEIRDEETKWLYWLRIEWCKGIGKGEGENSEKNV